MSHHDDSLTSLGRTLCRKYFDTLGSVHESARASLWHSLLFLSLFPFLSLLSSSDIPHPLLVVDGFRALCERQKRRRTDDGRIHKSPAGAAAAAAEITSKRCSEEAGLQTSASTRDFWAIGWLSFCARMSNRVNSGVFSDSGGNFENLIDKLFIGRFPCCTTLTN